MAQLNEWLRKDTEKLFEEMAKAEATATECSETVGVFTERVRDLQASEHRNDAFMQDLLVKAERLELFKLNLDRYEEEKEQFNDKLL